MGWGELQKQKIHYNDIINNEYDGEINPNCCLKVEDNDNNSMITIHRKNHNGVRRIFYMDYYLNLMQKYCDQYDKYMDKIDVNYIKFVCYSPEDT